MEALLRGQLSTLVPAAMASAALFAVNGGLLRYVFALIARPGTRWTSRR